MGLTLRPASEAEVPDAVRELRGARRRAVVVGGGTLVDVAEPGAACDAEISTAALDAIPYHEPADLIVTVGAGVTLSALDERLASSEQILPVWHPFPERATVGGLVAFGWTGLGRRLYGRLRDRVLEVRVVTGEGRLIRGGAKVVKNVTGFDLPRLFCGSMGTLGVICEATLKVHPRPPELFARVRSGEDREGLAVELREGLAGARQPVEAVLALDERGWRAVAFAPGPDPDAAALLDAFSGFEPPGPADAEWVRLARDPVLCPGPADGIVYRAAVPPSRALDLVARLGGVRRAVVDAGSGVAWVAPQEAGALPALRAFAEGAGGSLVILRAPDEVRRELGVWGSPPAGIELMRRMKAQLDPDGVLGAGRFVV